MANTWITPSAASNQTGSAYQQADATSFLNSEVTTTALTTSFVSSTAFTPGAITIDGIGIKVVSVSATPSGTISVQLANAGTLVTGTLVSCNVSDLPPVTGNLSSGNTPSGTWCFFKFASPVTLSLATAYTLQVKTSVTGMVSLYSLATTNWSRFLRTTTTGALSAGDSYISVGDIIGAGSLTRYTFTHNGTAATQYATFESGFLSDVVWGTAVSTAYNLTLTGSMIVGGGSSLTMSPDPTSTYTVSFPQTGGAAISSLEFRYRSVIRITGTTKTTSTFLNANASASATSITTLVSTSWPSGDDIAIAPTGTVPAQFDRVTMTGPASGTSVPVPALSFAHGGVSPVVAEVANLTRNINFVGNSTTNTYYAKLFSDDYQIQYATFQYCGSSTTYKRGIGLGVVAKSGSFFNYCVMKDFNSGSAALDFNESQSIDNFKTTGCIFFGAFTAMSTTSNIASANCTFTNVLSIQSLVSVGDNFSIWNGVNISGVTGAAFNFQQTRSSVVLCMTNVNLHSNSAYSTFYFSAPSGPRGVLASNITVWRQGNIGLLFGGGSNNCVVQNCTMFGNGANNLYINGSNSNFMLQNFNIQAGTTNVCPVGVYIPYLSYLDGTTFDNFSIGTVTQHTTSDIQMAGSASGIVCFRNSLFGSTTLLTGTASMVVNARLGIQNFNQNPGAHRNYQLGGSANSDTTIYPVTPVSTGMSQRLTPTSASIKLNGGSFIIPVAINTTFTVTVQVRTSSTVAGDSSTYNGNAPRLIMKANPGLGSSYNNDAVVATAISSAGAWQTLTYLMPSAVTDNGAAEFYIDCDGTTGFVNWGLVGVS